MRTVETFGESGLRILYFSQFYPPESIAGAFRLPSMPKPGSSAGRR